MQFSDLNKTLSASLSHQDWTVTALEHHLVQRLPTKYRKAAGKLAAGLKQTFPSTIAPDPAKISAFLKNHEQMRQIWHFATERRIWPDPWVAAPTFRPDPALAALTLPQLTTPAALADWLGITSDQLTRFADLRQLSALSGSYFAPHYRHHLLPKRDGGIRLIEEPKPYLNALQRRILRGLLNHVPPHQAAYGFRVGHNCIQAAAKHAGEQLVMGFDLADFFPTIRFGRIYGLFRALGYPRAVALSLTGLCTSVIPTDLLRHPGLSAADKLSNRHLPQGAPTSPVLANLCCYTLDRRLAGLAHSLGATYTRYADDLTFSGDARISRILADVVPRIIAEEGFRLNTSKTRAMSATRQQRVTGLVINQHVNLSRDEYDRLKAILHHLSRPTDPRRQDPRFLVHLSGRIAWVEQVNPHRGQRLRQRFDAALSSKPTAG